MKSSISLLSVMISLFIVITTVHAKTLNLVTFSYPPYEYSVNNRAEGIVVRILQNAFAELDQEITIEILPWKRAIAMVKSGEADAIFTAFKNDERVKFLDYSEFVLMPQILSVWVLKNSNISFDGTLKSLSETQIGLVSGISYGKSVDTAIKGGTLANVEYAPGSKNNVKKLIAGWVDAIIMNKYGAMYHLKSQNALGKVQELQPQVSTVPSYIAFSKANNLSELRDKLDVLLQTMKDSGEYQNIITDYLDQ